MFKNLSSLAIVLLLLSQGCKENSKSSNEEVGEVMFSTQYIPPQFTSDDRKEQIESIAPKLHQLFDEYAENRNIPGIAYGVVVDNALVVDSAVGDINRTANIPASTEAAFRIASMTKSFTAMAILKLIEDGKLALHDPASMYVTELATVKYPAADASPITIENLLTMTAGFPEDNPWGDRQLDESEDMLKKLFSEGIQFSNPPSYTYEYSNTAYATLGLIISTVSGMPFEQYITRNILEPLGMRHTYWEIDNVPADKLAIGYRPGSLELEPMLHHGVFGAMGGLITSIKDFSKYVSFHLSAWPPRSDPDNGPISRSSLREMHQPQYVRLYTQARDWNDEVCPAISGYGYGLGILENCKGMKRVSHGGALPGFGSNYVFYPDLGIGLMAFCNLTYTSPWPYTEILKLLFEELDLEPRQPNTSNILKQRQGQIIEWIELRDTVMERTLFAENFFLDEARDRRLHRIDSLMEKAGSVWQHTDIKPLNQLRGSFDIITNSDTLHVFMTLSPEAEPRVQYLAFEE